MKNKFTKIFSVIALVFTVALSGILFTGCGNKIEMPPVGAEVLYNGGDAVQVGDYLYFANGYVSHAELTKSKENKKGKVKHADLVRVKLVNGNIEYDEKGNPKNLEVIVSKIVGSENTSLFVHGEYIYFSSPNIHKNNQNQNKFDLVSIFRVKLNGKDLKEIYTTPEFSNGSFGVYTVSEKDYLLINTGTRVVRFEVGNKISKATELFTDATSMAFPESAENFNGKIFFTTARSEEDTEMGLTGNLLKYVDVVNGEVTTKSNINGTEYSILLGENGEIVYTKTEASVNMGVFKTSFNGDYTKGLEGASKRITYATGITNFKSMGIDNQGKHMGYVFVYESKLVYLDAERTIETVTIHDASVTILFVQGEYVYFADGTSLKRVSRFGDEVQIVVTNENMITTKFDCDGRYVYFYAVPETEEVEDDEDKEIVYDKHYMYRVSLSHAENGTTIATEILSIKVGEKVDKN